MYIYGAMAALLLSFVVLALFFSGEQKVRQPWQREINVRWLSRLRPLLGLALLLFFALAIVTGLLGNRDPYRNFSMTFVWIVFALGGSYCSVLFGNWYALLNPWLQVSNGISRFVKGFAVGRYRYPTWLAYWPALFLYMGFITLELFANIRPFSLAVSLLVYTAISLVGVFCFGVGKWFRYGEFFAVMFRLLAMMSPVVYRPGGSVMLRLPFSGLRGQRLEHRSLLLFLLFMLSSTAFDGLRETTPWFNVFWKDPYNILTPLLGQPPIYAYLTLRPWYIGYEILWLLLSPLIYLLLFYGFLWLGKTLTKSRLALHELALRFGYSLLPIAAVYHVTHYYTLLLSQGVKIRGLISDPFGWSWNLFGSAYTGRIPVLPDMGVVWNSQVWLILIGHVASVYLAHAEALRVFPNARQATLSQLPMLLLMLVFTGFGLWILAQPLQG